MKKVESLYLQYVNEFLTVERFAEYHGLGLEKAHRLLQIGRKLNDRKYQYVTEDNFFDVAEAIHCYCSLNHSGQWSKLYSILSQSEFKPGYGWSESRVEKDNDFYNEITEANISLIFKQLQKFLQDKDKNEN